MARRQRRGRLPAGRGRQLARPDRPQPVDGDDQRGARRRHPRSGGRRHDRRRQYSGIGGHEDFISGAALALEDRSLLCLPSTFGSAASCRSRIVPWFEAGAVITTPRHQVDVIVTEHGAAELQGKTVHQRGEAWPRSRTPTSATSCSRRPSAPGRRFADRLHRCSRRRLGAGRRADLVFGAVAELTLRPPSGSVAFVMAFGAGVLISAVAYDLRRRRSSSRRIVAGGLGGRPCRLRSSASVVDRRVGKPRSPRAR